MANNQSKKKSTCSKSPKLVGLDPDFVCDRRTCETRKLDLALQDLKLKHWTDTTKLAKYCVRNKKLPLDSHTAYRLLIGFFKKVHDSYKNSHALSTYASNCKSYWTKNQEALLTELKSELHLKKLELEEERSKKLTYNLRRARRAKEESTTAAVEYHSSAILAGLAEQELVERPRQIQSGSSSLYEEYQHSEDKTTSIANAVSEQTPPEERVTGNTNGKGG